MFCKPQIHSYFSNKDIVSKLTKTRGKFRVLKGFMFMKFDCLKKAGHMLAHDYATILLSYLMSIYVCFCDPESVRWSHSKQNTKCPEGGAYGLA